MEKAIVTILLTIAGIVCAMLLFNAVYPAVGRGSGALVSVAGKVDERIRSQVSIVHAVGELDTNGNWQDTNGNTYFDVFIWVKNVGASTIGAIEESDVFFGKEGEFSRILYKDDAGGALPYWEYQIENDTEWVPTATTKITITFSSALSSGTYFIKVVIPSGVSDEIFFSM
jgi:hypothetical protein